MARHNRRRRHRSVQRPGTRKDPRLVLTRAPRVLRIRLLPFLDGDASLGGNRPALERHRSREPAGSDPPKPGARRGRPNEDWPEQARHHRPRGPRQRPPHPEATRCTGGGLRLSDPARGTDRRSELPTEGVAAGPAGRSASAPAPSTTAATRMSRRCSPPAPNRSSCADRRERASR